MRRNWEYQRPLVIKRGCFLLAGREEKRAYDIKRRKSGNIEAITDTSLGNFFPTTGIPASAISIFTGNYHSTKAATVLL
jgi:hypothetical protein